MRSLSRSVIPSDPFHSERAKRVEESAPGPTHQKPVAGLEDSVGGPALQLGSSFRPKPASRFGRATRTPAFAGMTLGLLLLISATAVAQAPTYGLGRAPTAAEVRAWDIMISPTGAELPPGSGTAIQGVPIYEQKCAHCHGARGVDGDAPRLVKPNRTVTNPWDYGRILPIRSPYATLVWDFINRGMPLEEQGTLTANEVYALTALLLYWNGLVAENDVMNAQSLPAVKMPMADRWAQVPDWAPGQPRYPGYPY